MLTMEKSGGKKIVQATRPRKKKWGTKIRTTIPKYEMETVRLIARKGEENAKNAKLFVMTKLQDVRMHS